MYPFLRSAYHMWKAGRMGPLKWFDTHVSHHWVGPFDIDPWIELNNGRTLTLYDLGRLPMYHRLGVLKSAQTAGMYFTVAGASVRYRARVTPFSKVQIRSRMAGFDDRFLYNTHSMWQGDTCANQALIRTAIARRGQGIVPPAEAARILGIEVESPPLPDWIKNWIEAEGTRPWPPE